MLSLPIATCKLLPLPITCSADCSRFKLLPLQIAPTAYFSCSLCSLCPLLSLPIAPAAFCSRCLLLPLPIAPAAYRSCCLSFLPPIAPATYRSCCLSLLLPIAPAFIAYTSYRSLNCSLYRSAAHCFSCLSLPLLITPTAYWSYCICLFAAYRSQCLLLLLPVFKSPQQWAH